MTKPLNYFKTLILNLAQQVQTTNSWLSLTEKVSFWPQDFCKFVFFSIKCKIFTDGSLREEGRQDNFEKLFNIDNSILSCVHYHLSTHKWKDYLPIQWSIVSNCRYHDDAISSQFPNFINKWMIHEVWSSNTEIQYIDFLQYCIIKGIQEPRGVRNLQNKKKIAWFINLNKN